ncbi:MAG: peptidoglycan-binding protein [Blastocatellia bacterium]|nr:peptidoglycan-binding protein [Blastocatellia bacterium]
MSFSTNQPDGHTRPSFRYLLGAGLSLALLATSGGAAPLVYGAGFAQDRNTYSRQRGYEVPAGTVLKLRMDRALSSASARVGDSFTATVFESVIVGSNTVIPQGTRVEGRVASVEPAQRGKSGMIAVDFERLVFANNRSLEVDGHLTSLDPREKQQIDDEGRASGGSTTKRNVIFIGGGAGVGAAIGAIAGGGKGAAIGSGVGAAAGILGALLTKGYEAEVKTGQTFGLELDRAIRVSDDDLSASRDDRYNDNRDQRDPRDDRYNDNRDRRDPQDDRYRDRQPGGVDRRPDEEYTDFDFVKRAQLQLRDKGFYNAPPDGNLSPRMRAGLRNFQRNQRLEETGRLDLRTAQALGLVDRNGNEIRLVAVTEARAIRQSDRSLKIELATEVNSGGWDVYADYEIRPTQLDVWARGVPPRGVATTVVTRKTVTVIPREDVSKIDTVVVHTDSKDLTLKVEDATTAQTGGGKAIKAQAERIVSSLRTQLRTERSTYRNSPPTVNWQANEAEANLYANMASLLGAAQFYAELVDARASDAAQRGAVEVLVRSGRRVSRSVQDAGRSADALRRDFDELDRLLRQLAESYRLNTNNY